MRVFFLITYTIILFSCGSETKEFQDLPLYEGPVLTFENFETDRTENAKLKATLKAMRQNTYENGDQEFPEGIHLIFFEDNSDTSATLIGDQAYYEKETNLYRAWGNVRVRNYKENQNLNTEELFWDPGKKEVYTEKFVVIETAEEIIQGEGMTAKEDFSSYRITKPTGVVTLKDE